MLAVGLLAGLAAGAYVAHRLGGVPGISARMRRRLRPADAETAGARSDAAPAGDREARDNGDEEDEPGIEAEYVEAYAEDGYAGEFEDELDEDFEAELAEVDVPADEDEPMIDDEDEDEIEDDAFASADPDLEDRVLVAFTNDPVLSERAIDIGAVNAGTIELTGTVNTDDEYEHATVVARGVPGVETVVNRLTIRDDEAAEDTAARHYAAGDPRFTEARWESEIIGTGRPRQGTSQDVGRHADPKVPLEDRALSETEALRNAADDTDDITSQRRRRGSGGASGAGQSAGGVPQADHVRPSPPPAP
jgi:hypothetical protein